jgi:hypothetical protein
MLLTCGEHIIFLDVALCSFGKSSYTFLRNVGKKVKLSLCFTNEALCHEGVWGSGCIDPHFLDLGTIWRWISKTELFVILAKCEPQIKFISDLCSWGFCCGTLYPKGRSPVYYSSSQANSGIVFGSRPRPILTVAFPIHFSLLILSFDAWTTELQTASSHRPYREGYCRPVRWWYRCVIAVLRVMLQ